MFRDGAHLKHGRRTVSSLYFSLGADSTSVPALLAALKACTSTPNLTKGKSIHAAAIRSNCDSNLWIANSLINMYGRCASLNEARQVFDRMRVRTIVSWTVLISGYAANGEGEVALDLFSRMERQGCTPDGRILVVILKVCSDLAAKEEKCKLWHRRRGNALQSLASCWGCDSDIFVECCFLDLFSKCNRMEEAFSVFCRMKRQDVATWSALVLGYAENGEGERALDSFSRMWLRGFMPNQRTFMAALKGCIDLASKPSAKEESRERGKAVHSLTFLCGYDSDSCVGNTLVEMYGKCGSMEGAHAVFDGMKSRDVVSWTTLMLGYAENGDGETVLELFERMKHEGYQPSSFTFVPVLKACGMVGALELGRGFHAEIYHRCLDNALLGNCLVDFYAKCGSLKDAQQAFDSHASKTLVTWTTLITGYSRIGDAPAVFGLLERMRASSMQPSRVASLCVLTACSHAGLVGGGKEFFDAMSQMYGLEPEVEHYTCMVSMLGRANKLNEAMALLRKMHVNPDAVTWLTVLAAGRKWKNVKLGKLAFDSVTSLDDKNAGAYVLMSNIYGSQGMWRDQATLQAMRKRLKIWKKPGQSCWWTNQGGVVHRFLVNGDQSHPQSQEIQDKLKELGARMREHGYVADLSSVTRNMTDLEKEDALCGHSEKLAIACALINSSPGETIRIIKNLRVCDDCHTVTALVSKLEDRTIVCRDATRFHIFEKGTCSCGDFW